MLVLLLLASRFEGVWASRRSECSGEGEAAEVPTLSQTAAQMSSAAVTNGNPSRAGNGAVLVRLVLLHNIIKSSIDDRHETSYT